MDIARVWTRNDNTGTSFGVLLGAKLPLLSLYVAMPAGCVSINAIPFTRSAGEVDGARSTDGETDAAVVELWDGTPEGFGTQRRLDGDGVPAVCRGARVFRGDPDRVLLVRLRAEPPRAREG